MKNMVEIEIILDEQYADPHVTIKTKSNTQQVENIICAIENASNSDYPQIAAHDEGKLLFISQRDIVRAHTQGRKVILETEDATYSIRKSISALEEVLDSARFLRISQSEIINLYKVKCFDLNMAGTIGVEFDCGIKSWASRSRVRKIKEMLAKSTISEV
ncbi:MAG: LytTR family transcriptional regulator [Lachnospiraceae bacterium]|nr:LytTR family transcriptional regulator [Lachnospiraceae bacterium]